MTKLVSVFLQLGKSTRRDGNMEANKWLLVPSHGWVCPVEHQPAKCARVVKPLCLGFQALEVDVVKVIGFWVIM